MNIFEWDENTPVTANNLNEMQNILNENIIEEYSTNETLTHKKWIDGKPIYRKVVDIGNLPNNTTKRVVANTSNLDSLISIQGLAFTTTKYYITLPDVYPNQQIYNIRLNYEKTTDEIVIVTTTDRSSYSGYVILEYTK